MKRLSLLVVFLMVMLLLVSQSFAWCGPRVRCIHKSYHETTNFYTDNDCYDRAEFMAGAGIDFILWRNRTEDVLIDRVTVETRHDFMNDEATVYVVATIDLSVFWQ